MALTYLILGSNLGNREESLRNARVRLEARAGELLRCSSVYETASWGKHDQPDFLNQVLEIKTSLSPSDLLATVLSIEKELGRYRAEKWGSRTIDIDILFYDDRIIDEPGLIIPHPFLHDRHFCLLPLSEIAPDLVHPRKGKTIKELLVDLSDNLSVKKLP